MTKMMLDSKGVPYVEVNITENPDAREYVTEELGYTDSFRSAGMTGGLFGDFFSRPFGMLEPFFSGLGSRMLTEFPEPVDVLGQARESTPAQEDTGDLLPRDSRMP